MEDVLLKATAEGVRIYTLRSTQLVAEAASRHHCAHLAAAALGRLLSGALLLGATMKEAERLSIRLQGDGPLGCLAAEVQGPFVRGYVEEPDAFLPLKAGKLDVGGGVGAGRLSVSRFLASGPPFTGYAELVDGEIASDLTHYLYVSEQTPASVALGVLVGKEGVVKAAGGFFVQALPGCQEEVLERLEANIQHLPYVTQLLELGYGPRELLGALAKGLEYHVLESYPVAFKCPCSRERMGAMLATLSREDLAQLAQEEVTEVQCQFCGRRYNFTAAQLRELIENK